VSRRHSPASKLKTFIRRHGIDVILWSLLIGVIGGLSSAGYREANIWLTHSFTRTCGDIVAIAESLDGLERLLIPTMGGFLAGILLTLARRYPGGKTGQDYLEAIRTNDGVIPFRATLIRLASSLFSVSSGSSIGREGGMVQLSAMLISVLGQKGRMPPERLRLLVGCGGAAGLAAAYNTPLAGALFIAEIVTGSLAMEVLGPLIIAAFTSTLVVRHWIGAHPIFTSRDIMLTQEVDLMPLLGLGALCGILAPIFMVGLNLSRKGFDRLHLPTCLRLAFGGLGIGLLSLKTPEVWGNGYSVVESLLSQPQEPSQIAMILGMKVLATFLAVGSGAIGGVFTTTLLLGASTGWLFGSALTLLCPSLGADPVYFSAVAMGAFLAGTTHAPIMAILMIFEMTLDANLVFPLILSALIAGYLSRILHPRSIYQR
jgi:chloride channel protein, CIC family